jgi:hypothetical protein
VKIVANIKADMRESAGDPWRVVQLFKDFGSKMYDDYGFFPWGMILEFKSRRLDSMTVEFRVPQMMKPGVDRLREGIVRTANEVIGPSDVWAGEREAAGYGVARISGGPRYSFRPAGQRVIVDVTEEMMDYTY